MLCVSASQKHLQPTQQSYVSLLFWYEKLSIASLLSSFDSTKICTFLPFHIIVHAGEIVLDDVVGGSHRDGAKPEGGLERGRVGQRLVVQPGQVGELLAGDHERGQVGSVDGQEDEGEGGPDVGHESGRITARAVHVDGSLKEDRPHQPQCP